MSRVSLVTFLLVLSVGFPSALCLAVENPEEFVPAAFEASVKSVTYTDSLEEDGKTFRKHDRQYRLAVVELELRCTGTGSLPVSPGGYSIACVRSEKATSVASRALGVFGEDDDGRRKRFWAEARTGAITSLHFNMEEGESRRIFLLFDIPLDTDRFYLNVPAMLERSIRVDR